MDSVKNNTPPPEINKCNVLYKDQEFYSKSIEAGKYKEQTDFSIEYNYFCLLSLLIIIIICISLIYNAKNKYQRNESIILYVSIIIILFISILCSSLAMTGAYDYIIKPTDLTRPCYSSKMNAILYTDEQLKDIYNNK
jgi:hypothetical protein